MSVEVWKQKSLPHTSPQHGAFLELTIALVTQHFLHIQPLDHGGHDLIPKMFPTNISKNTFLRTICYKHIHMSDKKIHIWERPYKNALRACFGWSSPAHLHCLRHKMSRRNHLGIKPAQDWSFVHRKWKEVLRPPVFRPF